MNESCEIALRFQPRINYGTTLTGEKYFLAASMPSLDDP